MATLAYVLKLNLAANYIATLELLNSSALAHLIHLDLSENRLEALPPLALPALKVANFAKNGIASCEGYTGHPRLERLDLSENKLSNLTGLAEMPLLSSLNLAHNEIVSVDGLTGLPALADLSVATNQIEALDGPWEGMPHLESLNASANRLGAPAPPAAEGEEPGPA